MNPLPGMERPTPNGGAMVRAVESTINRARAVEQLDPMAEPFAALAIELARAVDVASERRAGSGVAQASRELREVLERLGLTPRPRAGGASGDPFAEFLAGLDTAEVEHP